ncbi:Dna2/Cas4 domain-containing protein [Methanoplanus sp. FWC-SCC4]|uniref:Dna2/Cas4 domain-containing protein n=1 Tax=Methanochimaera problematica TaxID=2609417 RepID=A0AA97I3V5_9EURY|nr:Dna2/Cas4 domain-containing protein [Methanoplanus sp. FWC-SCC4]WOF15646.1 Dna2/Cas4 domain-containing protein [Methanoplanus sp. FWC-SCC4]
MESISISKIVSCHTCPVRFVIEQKQKKDAEPENYTIAKQISYHLGEELIPENIWEEIEMINPEMDNEAKELFSSWIDSCKKTRWPRASQTDVRVKSDKLKIHGTIDRFFNSKPQIAIARPITAPENGIYTADRIRAACYSICAGEHFGTEFDEVIIEYIPSGISRICKPQPRDRRYALNAIKTAHKIKSGFIPKKPENAPCTRCYLKEQCPTIPKRLSDII